MRAVALEGLALPAEVADVGLGDPQAGEGGIRVTAAGVCHNASASKSAEQEDTSHVLVASLFTRNHRRPMRPPRELPVGGVRIDTRVPSAAEMPQGRSRNSGHGKTLSIRVHGDVGVRQPLPRGGGDPTALAAAGGPPPLASAPGRAAGGPCICL
ncbi:hypothetical protein [Streptomyces flaveolus]|uniref:hypothetical protein n=1 Tax=Streptomyces flaveolus TaxID=67297 RepID=UPI00331A64A1